MNLDALKRFPNQNIENRFNFCVGETIADILGNKYSQPFDCDYSYAAGLAVQALPPNIAGEDPYAAFLGACAYGALPKSADIDPPEATPLYEATFSAYTLQERQTASIYAQNGVTVLYGFDAITEHLLTKRQGVAIAMKWYYQSFNNPYPDGTLRTPGKGEPFSYHCVAAYENTDKGLRIKPWQGPDYGLGGYGFLPRSIYSQCFPTGYAFSDEAIRFLTVVKTALQYPKNLGNMLPLIYSLAKLKYV